MVWINRIKWALFLVTMGCLSVGCKPTTESRTRRLALKEGLRVAQEARVFKSLKAGEVIDDRRLRSIFERMKTALTDETKNTQIEIRSRFSVPAAGEDELKVSDVATIQIHGPDYWGSTRTATWTDQMKKHSLGRRCIRVNDDFYTGSEHGSLARIATRAREDQRCLVKPLELVTGWLNPIRSSLNSEILVEANRSDRRVVRLKLSGSQDREVHPIPRTWQDSSVDIKSPAVFGPRGYIYATRARLVSLSGTLELGASNAALISGEINAEFLVRKDEQDAKLIVKVTVETNPFEGEILAPEKSVAFTDRPRLFNDMKVLLKIDAKGGAGPSLPQPGDQPRLVVGADGKLTTGKAKKPLEEDKPPAPPARVLHDEDLPR